MTDRTRVLTVALDKEYRDDDVEFIKNAIRMIKGVIAVEHEVSGPSDWANRESVRMELEKKLYKALREDN